ncbi:hypothetical protein [Nocardia sp. NPDC004711]
MAGESEQAKGRQGALLAKLWLNRTTRATSCIVNPDNFAKQKLTLKKADYRTLNDVFSFDLGGRLRGGELEGQDFLAEVKNYKNSSNLPGHFRDFLAHCYRAMIVQHLMADNFFWIAFSPHTASKWDQLANADAVKAAVLDTETRGINFTPEQDPQEEFLEEVAKEVSNRIWMIVLSEKQIKHLTLLEEHHRIIEGHIVQSAGEIML